MLRVVENRTVPYYSYRIADYVLPIYCYYLIIIIYIFIYIYIVGNNKSVNARCSCSDYLNPGFMIHIEVSYRLSLSHPGASNHFKCHTGSQHRKVVRDSDRSLEPRAARDV